jgi:hypothetical protein
LKWWANAQCFVFVLGFSGCDPSDLAKDFIGEDPGTDEPDDPDTTVSLNLNTLYLGLETGNNSATLEAAVSPANAANKAVTWTSSNEEVAKVNADGKVTSVAEGTATVTVTTEAGKNTAVCNVTVQAGMVKAEVGVPQKLGLAVGETETLDLTVNPGDANKTVQWKSSNTGIATVDAKGNVKGVKTGSATVTVTAAYGGSTAKCAVTVKPGTSDTTPPADVTGLDGTPGNGQVVLSWTDPADADLDHIEVTWTPGGATPQTVNKGIRTYTATGLANGTTDTIPVRHADTAGNKNSGAPATAMPVAGTSDTTPPADVTGLDGTPGDKQVTLAWTDPADTDLAFIEITWTPNGATPQTVPRGTQTYTATGLANGTTYTFTVKAVDTSVNKNTGASIQKTPSIAPGTPVNGAADQPNIKYKFGVSEDVTGTASVEAAFKELSAFIKNGGLTDHPDVIEPGDWIELEGGLQVTETAQTASQSLTEAERGKIDLKFSNTEDKPKLRLIVVGINSFQDKTPYEYQGDPNNNPSRPHVVFQFENIPGTHRMNWREEATENKWESNYNTGGYVASEMHSYVTENFLAGLKSAGVPEDVLWPPTRTVSTSGTDASPLTDLLWLPTEREMFVKVQTNAAQGETAANQARLEYYTDDTSREKSGTYWLASTRNSSDTAFNMVFSNGVADNAVSARLSVGVAPAFCVYGGQ